MNTPTHIFGIPRELRNLIYHLCWQSKDVLKVMAGPLKLLAQYNDSEHGKGFRHNKGKTTLLPLWLLTSKQILREGLERFASRATWTRKIEEPKTFSVRNLLCTPSSLWVPIKTYGKPFVLDLAAYDGYVGPGAMLLDEKYGDALEVLGRFITQSTDCKHLQINVMVYGMLWDPSGSAAPITIDCRPMMIPEWYFGFDHLTIMVYSMQEEWVYWQLGKDGSLETTFGEVGRWVLGSNDVTESYQRLVDGSTPTDVDLYIGSESLPPVAVRKYEVQRNRMGLDIGKA